MGEVGPTGAAGPQGAEGLSGFVTVLNYDVTVSTAPFVSVGPSTSIPAPCQTASYTAGENEIAIVSVDITYFSGITSSIFLAPLYAQGAGGAQFASSFVAAPLTMNSWGSLHGQAPITLTAGASYRFFTGVAANANVSFGSFTCRGMVTIVRKR